MNLGMDTAGMTATVLKEGQAKLTYCILIVMRVMYSYFRAFHAGFPYTIYLTMRYICIPTFLNYVVRRRPRLRHRVYLFDKCH